MRRSKRNPFAMTFLLMLMSLIPACMVFSAFSTTPLRPWGPAPSASQLAYHKEELSAFIHFGMNTFTNKEWGTGKELPSQFTLDPAKLDTDQWVSIIKGAGFKRIIFVAKHHDGFCNWFTDLTQHSVKYANPASQVDVLERLSKSCTAANMNMGVYLSPWDVNSPYYGAIAPGQTDIDPWPYNKYYVGQLREILDPANKKYGNAGAFVEVWMDGARGKGFYQPYFFDKDFFKEAYALKAAASTNALAVKYLHYPDSLAKLDLKPEETWLGVIRAFNPDTVVFSPVGTELRWPATESGHLAVPVWLKIEPKKQRANYIANEETESRTAEKYLAHGDPNGTAWSIPEADTSILASGWFENDSPNQLSNKQVKTLRELGDIYFESVGRGGVLLLNFAPNVNGVLSDFQATRAKEFGDAIRGTFTKDLARGAKIKGTSHRSNSKKFAPTNVVDGDYDTYWTLDDGVKTGSITIDLGQDKVFDVVSIQEYIPLGQRISQYKVEVFSNGSWAQFGNPAQQQTIGYKALVRNPAVTASKVRVTIIESQAVPVINSIGVYKTAVKDFELVAEAQ